VRKPAKAALPWAARRGARMRFDGTINIDPRLEFTSPAHGISAAASGTQSGIDRGKSAQERLVSAGQRRPFRRPSENGIAARVAAMLVPVVRGLARENECENYMGEWIRHSKTPLNRVSCRGEPVLECHESRDRKFAGFNSLRRSGTGAGQNPRPSPAGST